MAREFGDVMLGSIELFCLAAEAESFTEAALQAGLTPAAVSRSVARLEERLQVRLFVRSTRQIRLTDGGRRYYDHCRQALIRISEAERELTGTQAEPAGTVRISVPTTLGHYRILPALVSFRMRYPNVQVEVELSNRNVDFTAESFDLAVRARVQADSGLIARRLLDADLVVVATPEYLRRSGHPALPEDLATHECIQFLLPSTGQAVGWVFRRGGLDFELRTSGGLHCAGDLLGVTTLARHGAGLLQTYRFLVEDDLAQGRLVEVLPEFAGPSRPFSIIYPAARHMPLRVRALIDHLIEQVAAPKALSPFAEPSLAREQKRKKERAGLPNG